MKDVVELDAAGTHAAHLAAMKVAYLTDPNPDYAVRIDRLKRLETALAKFEPALIKAMQDDFSYRSEVECQNLDIMVSFAEIKSTCRELRKWMRKRKYAMPARLKPARGWVKPQPLGVIGIIAPWNFPVYLALSPLVPALAAGNRAMIKPSELSPRTSEVLKEMIADAFDPLEVCVVTGGPDVAAEVSSLPFDHLLFTGSTHVGRIVAQAAAKNLTPVTLELGGKSPCIVGEGADLNRAARRIAFGKCTNAGQICVAPDYVLVPRAKMDEFAGLVEKWMRTFYPKFDGNPDYTAIITDRHRARIQNLVKEAADRGANVVRLEDTSNSAIRIEAPVLVIDPPLDLTIMQEEIFGPILAIVPYETREEAVAFIGARDRPLAMYIFSDDRDENDYFLANTIAGGVCINETLYHVAADTMPFGGVGASGIGAYHGKTGFDRFSHLKPILSQPKFNGAFVLEPPIVGYKLKVLNIVRRFL